MKAIKILVAAAFIGCFGTASVCAITNSQVPSSTQFTAKKRCTNCNGTGKVEVYVSHDTCNGNGCAACNYSGRMIQVQNCPYCDGGWIVTSRR